MTGEFYSRRTTSQTFAAGLPNVKGLRLDAVTGAIIDPGITITDANSNSIQMTSDGITIDASGKAMVLKADTIDMQKA